MSQFGDNGPTFMTKIYGVVGTQRSGSNYVCSALRSIEGLGDPREYFNPVHIHGEDKLIQSRQDALSFAMEVTRNTPKHQYFGFKIHYLQLFENFLEKDVSLLDAFPGMKTIFLRRSNVVKQAISLWKAELTQSWTAEMGAKRQPHYNFGEIRNRYFDLKIHDLMWERYLGDNHIQFLNII
jgi:LPS sulfotransferase NodH